MVFSYSHAESSVEGDGKEWEKWTSENGKYLNDMDMLMKKSREIAIQQNGKLGEAAKNNDRALGEKIVAETGEKLTGIIQELKAMNPPSELKEYNDKMVEAYNYRKLANDSIFMKDAANIGRENNLRAMRSELEATKIIKEVYTIHKAPQEIIDVINSGIANYEQVLDRQ